MDGKCIIGESSEGSKELLLETEEQGEPWCMVAETLTEA